MTLLCGLIHKQCFDKEYEKKKKNKERNVAMLQCFALFLSH